MVGGRLEAYFRGRRLRGREVKVPNGYKGIVVKESAKPQHGNGAPERLAVNDSDLEESRQMFGTSILHEVADFEDVVIWGHETCIEPEDVFVKALDEWVTFATSVSNDSCSTIRFRLIWIVGQCPRVLLEGLNQRHGRLE